MCKKINHAADRSSDAPFEGETQRLSLTRRRRCGAFPWWTLWLIWPLIGLFKAAGASIMATWASIGTWAIPANLVLAVGLIAVGTVVLLRQRQD